MSPASAAGLGEAVRRGDLRCEQRHLLRLRAACDRCRAQRSLKRAMPRRTLASVIAGVLARRLRSATMGGLAALLCTSATAADVPASPPSSSVRQPQQPPATMAYNGGPVPPGYRIASRPLYEVALPGAALLLGGVILFAYGAVQRDRVACDGNPEFCDEEQQKYLPYFMIGGPLAVGGLITAYIGFAIRSETLVRDDTFLASCSGTRRVSYGLRFGGASRAPGITAFLRF
jgi:hypothetical protein